MYDFISKWGKKERKEHVLYLLDCSKVHGKEDVLSIVCHDIRRNRGLEYLCLFSFVF